MNGDRRQKIVNAGVDSPLCIPNPVVKMDEIRHLYCKHYPSCLHLHARLVKRFFSCAGCRQYKPLQLDPEDVVDEIFNVAAFMRALFLGVEEEESEMEKGTEGAVYVKVPLEIIRSFQHALFLFAENAQAVINLGNRMAQIGDDLKQRITAGERMNPSNELRGLRGEADLESIEQRISDLEAKVEDIEMILAGLLPSCWRRSGRLISRLRSLVGGAFYGTRINDQSWLNSRASKSMREKTCRPLITD